MSTITKSIRLTKAEKRQIDALARKKGLSPATYIKRAALAGTPASDISRLTRLEQATAAVLAAVEDELDYRVVVAAWDRHEQSGAKLLTSAEAWRELGV